jgi:transposase
VERDLLVAGERIVRVPPKLMANARNSARSFGKSDPIDALAVARAARREPDLPVAVLEGPDRHCASSSIIGRTSWPSGHVLSVGCVGAFTSSTPSPTRRRVRWTEPAEAEISRLVTDLAPSLLAIAGCGPLNPAKIVGECASPARFRSANAFARHNGTAPLPVWSSNHQRQRLSRTGNRQLNAARYRIALTQIRMHRRPRRSTNAAAPTATVAWKHSPSSADAPTSSSRPSR